jgi:hypothetical protein
MAKCIHEAAIASAAYLDKTGWPAGDPTRRVQCACGKWVDSSGQVGPAPEWVQQAQRQQVMQAALGSRGCLALEPMATIGATVLPMR